jgi:hypothetical protein
MSNKFIKALSEWATRNDKKLNMDNLEADINSVEDVEQVVKQDESTLIKQFQSEERISVEIIAEPNVVDAHDNWYSVETVQKGYESFDARWKANELPMNLFHLKDDNELNTELIKHYVLPTDVMIGETAVKEGTWVGEVKWHNEVLWKQRTEVKDLGDGIMGTEIAGLSIKGWGTIHEAKES